MFENPINKLRFWCHKVIPLVYDEALSYYEVLCKVAKKINELITDVNGLHDTVVFQVNGKDPTDGNVQLEADDFGGALVGSVNGVIPDENGDVTIDAEDVDAMPADEPVVKSVNGVSPNADGSILAGTVRSVNGKSPSGVPTPGSITLNASDVGALPNSIDPVETVNGISPDTNGNVNVGTVKSVNSTLPDASGNVNLPTVAGVTSVCNIGPDGDGNVTLGASDVGALPNTIDPVETVNGISPDANGNVNVGTVKSVNSTQPDANGNVNVGTVKTVNSVQPDAAGNVAIKGYIQQYYQENIPVDSAYFTGSLKNEGYGNLMSLNGAITVTTKPSWGTGIIDGQNLPTVKPAGNSYYLGWDESGKIYEILLLTTGQLQFRGMLPEVGTTVRFNCIYGSVNHNINIVSQ